MFNLIVGAALEGAYATLDASRFLENVEADKRPDTDTLLSLPTLLTPERDERRINDRQQVARLGRVSELTKSGKTWRFRFTPNDIPSLPIEDIYRARTALDIGAWTLQHMAWTLRERDLYLTLAESGVFGSRQQPTAFNLPHVRPEPNRVAVMMPFAGFTPVYAALKEVAEDLNFVCERADDIWENAKVLDDIVLLIARASIVICDLTRKNANVFYETGLTHMLGRPTILIAQSDDDIPFDLRAERYLPLLIERGGHCGAQGRFGRPPAHDAPGVAAALA